MTQRNSYTTWAGLRRSNQDTQRNCAWKVTEVAVTRPLEVIRSRPCAYSTDATQCEVDLRSPYFVGMNPPQGETQGKQR